MCGIFGHYIFNASMTRLEIMTLLFQGLRRLEYRGYDSAGISIERAPRSGRSSSDGHIPNEATSPVLIKSKGNIDALEKLAWDEVDRQGLKLDVNFKNHIGTLPLCGNR